MPLRLAAAAAKQIQRLSVVLQALSRCSWFTSCLGLSGMPLVHSHSVFTAAEHSILARTEGAFFWVRL